MLMSTPILKLNSDIVGYILETIAPWDPSHLRQSSHHHHPLNVIRQSSQVCQAWRDVILKSSHIWARCIDLDLLNQPHPHWRNLVIQRSRESLLSVTSTQSLHINKNNTEFLINLLHTNWNRIQVLHIQTERSAIENPIIWTAFERPTDKMRVFSVIIYTTMMMAGVTPMVLPPQGFQLFSNQAPYLRHLALSEQFFTSRLNAISPLTVSRNLKELIIYQPIVFHNGHLLNACIEMPLLEMLSIKISDLVSDPYPQTNSLRPSMLRLAKIIIDTTPTFDIYSAFLIHITPQPGCALRIGHILRQSGVVPFSGQPTIRTHDVNVMKRVFTQYSSSYIEHHKSDEDIMRRFLLVIHPGRHFHASSSNPADFGLKVKSFGLPSEVLRQLLGVVASAFKFSHTTKHLQLYTINMGSLDALVMTEIFLSLSYITTLSTTPGNIAYLSKISKAQNLFPGLKMVNLGAQSPESDISEDAIMPFFESRQSTSPVKVFNLTVSNPVGDYRYLECLSGLKFTWLAADGSMCNYMCGSGKRSCLIYAIEDGLVHYVCKLNHSDSSR